MEELRSTEALDREILEDARKKADRALRNADQTAKALEIEWGKKIEADLSALQTKHAQRMVAKRDEINARQPLDKRRLRAERAERLLRLSMEKTLRALPRERVLALLERDLIPRARELGSATLVVHSNGLSEAETKTLLSHVLPGSSLSFAARVVSEDTDPLPSLVIEGDRITVRVGLAEAGEDILREKRAELATALLGLEALDD
ncbi:MAG: ATPase [Treponemataceae bacterium]